MGGFNLPQGMSLADAVKQFRPFAQGGEEEQEAPLADMVKSFAASGAVDGGDSSSVDPSSIDSSGRAKPEAPSALQRIDDDPQSRHNTDLTGGSGAMNAGDGFENQAPGMATASRASLADQVRQSAAPQQPSFQQSLIDEYKQPLPPQKPMSLAQKIALGIAAIPTLGIDIPVALARRTEERQEEEARYDQNRQRLLPQIMAGQREQQQSDEFNQNEDFQREQSDANRDFQREQAQPEHIDTEQGPLAYNRRTGQFEPIMVNGKAVGAKPGNMPNADVIETAQGPLQYDRASGQWKPVTVNGQPVGPKAQAEPGSWQLQEDAQGNPVEFNSKSGGVRPAPNVQARGTFAKAQAANSKKTDPLQTTLDTIEESREYAANPSATNDYGLLMNFIGVTKPEALAKLRLNQNEVSLATGTRGSLGDLQALGQRIANGEMLTSDQRQSILSTMATVEKFTQRRLGTVSGGGANLKQQMNGAPPSGATMKVPGSDGKLHWSDGKKDLGLAE